jgi:hypothetical protein
MWQAEICTFVHTQNWTVPLRLSPSPRPLKARTDHLGSPLLFCFRPIVLDNLASISHTVISTETKQGKKSKNTKWPYREWRIWDAQKRNMGWHIICKITNHKTENRIGGEDNMINAVLRDVKWRLRRFRARGARKREEHIGVETLFKLKHLESKRIELYTLRLKPETYCFNNRNHLDNNSFTDI